MKKWLKKIVCFLLVAVVSGSVFVGCSSSREVKKASKGLTSYAIEAVFCDEEKKITATESVAYVNNTGSEIHSIIFHLYGRAFRDDAKIKPYSLSKVEECFPNGVNYGDMQIKDVMVDGAVASHILCGEDENALEVKLNEPVKSGDKVEILLNFELYLANCTHRLGYNNGFVNLGNWYPIVACYDDSGFVVEPYWANGDPFYSEVANYEVTISFPEIYCLSATGRLKEENVEAGRVTATYSALAVRDFAMTLVDDFQSATETVDNVDITVVAKSGDENINEYLLTAKKTIELFNDLFGEYPYSTLSVVFTDFFQGGMEYPNLVYVSNSVEGLEERKKVIIHEIAHQWWYGLVGNNEVDMAWFDEGLAEYSTLLFYEMYPEDGVDSKKMVQDTIISYELYLDVIKTLNLDINYSMELSLDEYASEYEYVYMIYVKGLLFFDGLRETLGDDVFFKFLKTVVKEYKFKNIDKDGFVRILQKVSGVDMSEFVNNWLSGKVDNFK